jgi:pimeloyl-ACP methyl ester carboxylesterase
MKHITRPCRVLAPDLPCFGETPIDAVTSNNYVQTCVTWLRAFLQALRVTAPVVVVGTSMGGYIASSFAAAYPEQVRHLVLLAPAGVVRSLADAAAAAVAADDDEMLMLLQTCCRHS